MNNFILLSNNKSDHTLISNTFIDEYMPHANGSYVKVYIYLLRCISSTNTNLSISYIADKLEDTETDILRAITYWEKVHLLNVSRDSNNSITSISISDFNSDTDITDTKEPDNSDAGTSATASISNFNSGTNTADKAPTEDISYNIQNSISQIVPANNMTDDKELAFISSIAEKYIERMLTPNDQQLILYLYTKAGFSSELILELYEYCASQGKKQYRYIEAVASKWIENKVDSVEKAKASIEDFNSTYKAVIKEFGINRALGQAEKNFIDKWIKEYSFDLNIIKEACSRTLLTIQKPDFKYADRILSIWFQKNVHDIADIQALDKNHSKSNAKPVRNTQKTEPGKSSTNKFNSFTQRDYSQEEFNELEKRLLNK